MGRPDSQSPEPEDLPMAFGRRCPAGRTRPGQAALANGAPAAFGRPSPRPTSPGIHTPRVGIRSVRGPSRAIRGERPRTAAARCFVKRGSACVLAVAAFGAPVLGADPWADRVVSYTQGLGVQDGYDVPGAALGEPTRYTGQGVWPSAVTPFNPPFLSSEIVGIGRGGSLTLAFDEPVTDDAANPFGVDLLVFGNAFFAGPDGVAGVFGAGGEMRVSADGVSWVDVSGALQNAVPTLGYSDLTDPFATDPGAVLTDFTRPVDPAFSPMGLTFAQIVAAYNGSGGGVGIDLGVLGLSAISYVQFWSPADGVVFNIDAVADVAAVPAPGVLAVMAAAGLASRRRR